MNYFFLYNACCEYKTRLRRFISFLFIRAVNIALLTLAAFGVSGAVACAVSLFGR